MIPTSTGTSTSGAVAVTGYLTTGQVARRLGVDRVTVYRWIVAGRIPGAVRGVPQGAWRVPRAWVAARLAECRAGVIRRKP